MKQIKVEKVPEYRYTICGKSEFPLIKDLLKELQQLVNFCDEDTYGFLVREFLIFKTKMAKKLLLK